MDASWQQFFSLNYSLQSKTLNIFYFVSSSYFYYVDSNYYVLTYILDIGGDKCII